MLVCPEIPTKGKESSLKTNKYTSGKAVWSTISREKQSTGSFTLSNWYLHWACFTSWSSPSAPGVAGICFHCSDCMGNSQSSAKQSRCKIWKITTLTKVTLKAARQWKINFPLFPPQQLDGTFNLHEQKEDEIDFAENCWGYSLLSLNSLRVQMLIKCDHRPWVK